MPCTAKRTALRAETIEIDPGKLLFKHGSIDKFKITYLLAFKRDVAIFLLLKHFHDEADAEQRAALTLCQNHDDVDDVADGGDHIDDDDDDDAVHSSQQCGAF